MSRLVIAIALVGDISLSIPAFAIQDCLAYCQERCGSKGNYCKIKCNEKCQQRNSSKRSHLPTYFNYTSMARDYRWPSEWGRGYDCRGRYGWGYRKPDLVEVRKAASLGGLFHFQRADGVIE